MALALGRVRDLLFPPLKPAAGGGRFDRRWAAMGKEIGISGPRSGASGGRRELWLGRARRGRHVPLLATPSAASQQLGPVFDKLVGRRRRTKPSSGDAILILQRIRQHRGLALVRSGKWLCPRMPGIRSKSCEYFLGLGNGVWLIDCPGCHRCVTAVHQYWLSGWLRCSLQWLELTKHSPHFKPKD